MVDSGDALDNYLVWELCKQEGIQRMIMEDSAGEEELKEEIVEKVRQEYREKDFDLDEKINLLRELDSNPGYRLEVFENCSWSKETVKIEDLGTTLPRAGDLPPEVIPGSLPEVVQFVREADPEEYRSVRFIMNLKEAPEVLSEFLPWVVTPGNRPRKRDRMNKVHGEKNWNIEDTWGMINDGNHRTIAKILTNDLEEIECYVGHRQGYR
ncbi:MAG: hypothetical protein ABEJ99_03225 [Candidatus Nanohaloarchaea archaeon]